MLSARRLSKNDKSVESYPPRGWENRDGIVEEKVDLEEGGNKRRRNKNKLIQKAKAKVFTRPPVVFLFV